LFGPKSETNYMTTDTFGSHVKEHKTGSLLSLKSEALDKLGYV